MGVFLIIIALFAIGFLVCGIDDDFGEFIIGLSVGGFITALLILSIARLSVPGKLIEYEMEAKKIETIIGNRHASGQEIENAIETATRINTVIATDKYYQKSFMFGWFISPRLNNRKQFNIEKIQEANLNITIRKD